MNATYTALIALMRSGEISMEPGESLPASNAQFSVRIRPESRVFLDRCAEHLGISRAALFGLCIDGILAEVRGSIADRASTLYERFCLLMDGHGLNVVEQAQLLASWGIRTSVLASQDRTLDLLNKPLLQQLSTWFDVDVNWLLGDSSYPVDMADGVRDWSMQTPSILCRLQSMQSEDPIELIYFWQQGRQPHNVGLCLRYRPVISGVPVTLLRVYQALDWRDEQVRQAYNQLRRVTSITPSGHIKDKVEKYPPVRMRCFSFSARQMQALDNGEIIPAMIFNKPLGEYPGIP
ncbi:hypothetical protein [Salmonella enterica]|uniref:hypothetical protein n=1 Tax=Salmonella enterica TaxID=28901 RepID=UPI0008AA5BD0|nr:hypothetical protein [Salmonella enterica]ECB4834695.1 hypothetical protein [Salmonella enterica subsp. enterica serovar Bareilly]EDR1499687.1 hypothetical protein [Salmonella enterica subsp. enterica serovar Javiana]EDT1415251.1 hypothetical protein [Salmonella enterica subsp. enterica serovar Braenderup]EEE1992891.1 hypothetical protein [Salmonella enterica subsp. enterica]EAM1145141.1 hypothetical protein [Salmonella enterica]